VQASYELETASGETARVHSGESVLVPWPFAGLRSRERAQVRVRVTGGDGSVSDWSDWAVVEAGLLEPADWVARMVTPAEGAAALLRHTTELPAKPVRSARVYATAHGVYQLEIDGRRIGDDELAPGWTAYESRLRYQTYDVTGLVRGGRTTIGAWLADGWWRGHLGPDGRREFYGAELGLLAQLEVEFEDGERRVIATGAEWETAAGPIVSADLYNGEHFDARLLESGWSTPAAAADGWTPVTVSERDTARLVAADGPPVKVIEELPVADVIVSPSGRTILDFGQNLVGRLRIRVSGAAGDTVVLRHAEVLQAGELATGPLRSARATDTYVLRGEGAEQWAPRFTFHGFRYAEVNGWPGEFDPSAVVAQVLHSDLECTGWFTTSDPKTDRLHQNIVWSMRGNFLDIPTDCPQRDERLGWTGDVQVFAPTAEYLFDTTGFLTSWLRDLTAEQAHYGGTPMVVPAVTTGYNGPMAGWADAATVVPWTLYQATGDLGVLDRQFDSMLSWVAEVEARPGPTASGPRATSSAIGSIRRLPPGVRTRPPPIRRSSPPPISPDRLGSRPTRQRCSGARRPSASPHWPTRSRSPSAASTSPPPDGSSRTRRRRMRWRCSSIWSATRPSARAPPIDWRRSCAPTVTRSRPASSGPR